MNIPFFVYQILIEILFLFHVLCWSVLHMKCPLGALEQFSTRIKLSLFFCFWLFTCSPVSLTCSSLVRFHLSCIIIVCFVVFIYIMCYRYLEHCSRISRVSYDIVRLPLFAWDRSIRLRPTRWKEHIILYIVIHELLDYLPLVVRNSWTKLFVTFGPSCS